MSCQRMDRTSPRRWAVTSISRKASAMIPGSAAQAAQTQRISSSVKTRSRCVSGLGFDKPTQGLVSTRSLPIAQV